MCSDDTQLTSYGVLILGLKKDPGIPNLYPFKDQLLREIEERKQRVCTAFTLVLNSLLSGQAEETKKRQKEDRRKEYMKNRKGLEGLQQDAEKRNKEFDKKVKLLSILRDHNHNLITSWRWSVVQ